MSDEFFDLSGLGAGEQYIFPVGSSQSAPQTAYVAPSSGTSSGPAAFTNWMNAIMGSAGQGAKTFMDIKNTVGGKQQPAYDPRLQPQSKLPLIIGGIAVLGLGYFLLKGRKK